MSKSEFPKPYQSQIALAGESFSCYGSDFREIITYTFNNQGYRSNFDYNLNESDSLILTLGSSIATGHGLPLEQSFGSLVADNFRLKSWNLGQGCFRSSNQTIFDQINFFVESNLDIQYFIIQFTHINRMGSRYDSYLELDEQKALDNFCELLMRITDLLSDKNWCWVLMDYSQADFPTWVTNHPNLISIDPDIIDHVPVEQYQHLAPTSISLKNLSAHPGVQWHRNMADSIIKYFNEHKS